MKTIRDFNLVFQMQIANLDMRMNIINILLNMQAGSINMYMVLGGNCIIN